MQSSVDASHKSVRSVAHAQHINLIDTHNSLTKFNPNWSSSWFVRLNRSNSRKWTMKMSDSLLLMPRRTSHFLFEIWFLNFSSNVSSQCTTHVNTPVDTYHFELNARCNAFFCVSIIKIDSIDGFYFECSSMKLFSFVEQMEVEISIFLNGYWCTHAPVESNWLAKIAQPHAKNIIPFNCFQLLELHWRVRRTKENQPWPEPIERNWFYFSMV